MSKSRRKNKDYSSRIKLMAAALISLFAIGALRAVYLQVYRAESLRARAEDQYLRKIQILPARGKILDRNMEELAASVPGSSAYATSDKVLEDRAVFDRLCSILGLDRRDTASLIRRRKGAFTTLKRRITPAEEEAVRALGSKWVGVAPQSARFYPNKALAGQVLGFVGVDGEGLGGLEYKYEDVLRGNPVWVYAERDARADQLMANAPAARESHGKSLVLTLDYRIQHIVEDELEAAVKKSKAKGGFAVVMDPATGEVLALAQEPRLNPNDFRAARAADLNARTVTEVFEPGSTMKPLFMSLLLDRKKARPDEQVYCEDGDWKVHGRVIHDHIKYGNLNLADIIKVSSNIGVAKLSQRLGERELYEGFREFGFGVKSGIELSGESGGILPEPDRWSLVTPLTISYGQGISVTALQLTAAMAALANGGALMKPYLVSAVLDENGEMIERTLSEKIGQPVGEKTAELMMKWMERVVHDEGGTGTLAAGSGYSTAGKTGTAWKPDLVHGGYDRRRIMASFIGASPARKPRIVTLITIDEPTKGSRYGGMVAAPVYRNVVRRVLTYLGVAPDMPTELDEDSPEKAPARYARAGGGDEGREEQPAGKMPDLKGMTMREALRSIERTGMSIRLDMRGSGFAARQDPAPGAKLADNSLCTVTFESPLSD